MAAPSRLSSSSRALLAVAAFAVPVLFASSASADVAPAPKKKGCAVEAGAGDAREGAAAFAACAAAVIATAALRRARRKAR